jgi:hypothetical protein
MAVPGPEQIEKGRMIMGDEASTPQEPGSADAVSQLLKNRNFPNKTLRQLPAAGNASR